MDQSHRRQLDWTRILALIWLGLIGIVGALLCYIVSAAFRPPPQRPVKVGELDEYPPNSVNLEFIDASFYDGPMRRQLETLPLAVVREANGQFRIFLARSTRPEEGMLVPRQCIVEWNESLARFLELCGGSQWTREGKYYAGPAPRDLDQFPVRVEHNEVLIDLRLIEGAPRP